VAFAIPVTDTTDTSDPEILVSVQAPGNLGWVGFGFGEQMAGSLVFVMWPDDTNVVVSPRYASYLSFLSSSEQHSNQIEENLNPFPILDLSSQSFPATSQPILSPHNSQSQMQQAGCKVVNLTSILHLQV